MTKETKIGLLVGLAFIILFAIILSEKGANRSAKPPSALTLADASIVGQSSATGAEKPFNDAGRLPLKNQSAAQRAARPADEARMSELPIGRSIPGEDEPVMPLPRSVVERLNMPVLESSIPVDTESSERAGSMTLTDAVATALKNGPGQGGRGDAALSSTTPEMRRASHLDDPSRTAAAAKKPKKAMKTLAAHTIQPGESLGKIAAQYYGRATPARIAAIFNANRDKLRSIHAVRARDTLNIPELDDEERIAFEPVSDFPPARIASNRSSGSDSSFRIPIPVDERPDASRRRRSSDKRAASEPRAPFNWYQVQEKDTLSRIAKRELGDEKRFREIYSLNRDIIRNKHVIRPGMKIRLPMRQEGAVRLPGTVLSSRGLDAAEP